MKTMVKTIFCMFLTVALLSGCMRIEESFEVGADGTVKISAEVLYDKQKMLELGDEAGEKISEREADAMMQQEGYKIIVRDGKEYYQAPSNNELLQASNLKGFYQDILLPQTDPKDYVSLTETSFEALITADSQDMNEDMGIDDLFDDYTSKEEYELLQKYMKDSELVLTVTFATPVVKASEGAVFSEDKKTVSFSVPVTEKTLKEVYAYCENDIALDGLKSGMLYKNTVTYTIPAGVQATLNGIAVEGTVSSEKTGRHELLLKASDGTQKSFYYGVDKEAPVLEGIKKNGIYNGKKVIKISDSSDIAKVTVDGKNVMDELELDWETIEDIRDFKYSYYFRRLKEGKHTLAATDKLGNQYSVTFRIDKTAPKVTGVKKNKLYKKTVTIKVTDKNGVKSITLNGKNIKTGKKVSKKGNYTLVAKDVAGNKTTVKFKIKK